MNIALVTLQEDLDAYGIRCLSSHLRQHGHETKLIFLSRMSKSKGNVNLWEPDHEDFDSSALESLVEQLRDADLVGFSVLTLYYHESSKVSDYVRHRLAVPVIWGGIHSMIRPDECIAHADMVAIGEAEDTLLEVVERLERRQDLEGVAGIWFRNADGTVVKNGARQPARDLDRFPAPDHSLRNHFAFYNGALVPLTRQLYLEKTGRHYMTICVRGCHLKCTYCCNSQFVKMFDGWSNLRAKSVEAIVAELEAMVARFPEIEGIKLSDDDFGDMPIEYIRAFAEAYKARVGLPLGIPGFSSRNLTEEKLTTLLDAGLVYLRLGIQSGSERIRRLYGRRETNEQIVTACRLIHKYRDRIQRVKLDIITDNPWETEEDVIESIRLLQQLPKPYVMTVFSLTLLPGTPLYLKAKREGILKDEKSLIYDKHFYNFDNRSNLNRILSLFSRPRVMSDRIDELVTAYRDDTRFKELYSGYLVDLERQPADQAAGRFW